jgi:hypothetical protein
LECYTALIESQNRTIERNPFGLIICGLMIPVMRITITM